MRQGEVNCPFCEGDIPLDGDERQGDEVYCSYCNLMLKLKRSRGTFEAVEEDDYEGEHDLG